MPGYLIAYGQNSLDDVVIGHSHDRGNTWTWVDLAAQCGLLGALAVIYGLGGLEVSDYSQLVLLGVNECIPPLPGTWYTSIYHSHDHGHTWSLLYRFAGTGASRPVYSISLPERGNAADQVILCSTVFGGAGPIDALWRSLDGGSTFAVVGPAGYTTNWNHFEADPSNGRHYYAYTETGPDMRLHRSTDAGATWTALTLPGMLIQSGTGGHYPGSSIYFYSGLRVSVDGGVTWEDRTGNFWAIQQGGAQEHRRTIPLTPARTWGG